MVVAGANVRELDKLLAANSTPSWSSTRSRPKKPLSIYG